MRNSAPPPEAMRLIGRIGQDATLTLIEKHGGTRVYVPMKPDADSPLVKSIGLEAAQALAKDWGGSGDLKVPQSVAWRVRLYHKRGLSYAAIARLTGRSETTIWRILSGQESALAQLSLALDP